jgi:hypothetical protein
LLPAGSRDGASGEAGGSRGILIAIDGAGNGEPPPGAAPRPRRLG